jgi:nicotinic acid mononucleotide adenylyltransferase
MSTFYQDLNNSSFKGIISEVGLGIEFTAGLLRTPGASKTVLYFSCDYAGLEKMYGERAVSLENVTRIATANYERAITTAMEHEPLDHFFGLAISGAHYQDRDSHGWVAVKTKNYLAYMHFSIPMNKDRSVVGEWSAHLVGWFLSGCLLNSKPWTDHIVDYALPCKIDVLYAPGVSDIERLLFLGSDSLLAYQHGKFIRVVDILRTSDTIYSGSFNPPTIRHLEIENALFEISQEHVYKGSLSLEDLLHRVRMLDAAGKTILISRSARFIDKNRVLREYEAKKYCFLLGADAWNATIARHQYPTDDYLGKAMGESSFEIMPRDDIQIAENGTSLHVEHQISNHVYVHNGVSSTSVRALKNPCESHSLTREVADYMRRHKLYT